MKTSKLIVGIISIVLSLFVGFQSCVAGVANSLDANGESGGSAGFLVSISFLIAGIIAICTRNGGKGGYVSAIFYILSGLIGLMLAGSYSDLYIWSFLGLAFGVICIISTAKLNR